jgi:hypothetical protein
MSQLQTLADINQALETMGVTNEWAIEHMRISALEEGLSGPKEVKYKLFMELTGTRPAPNVSAFYSTMDKLLDQKILLLANSVREN